MAPTPTRSIANTAISLGLVSCPVKMYATSGDRGVEFNSFHVHDDGTQSRIKAPYICEDCGASCRGETTRGVVRDGETILLTDEELEQVQVDCGRTLDVQHFVETALINPLFSEKSYFLEPDLSSPSPRQTEEAYATLLAVLEEKGKSGIIQYTLRSKTHLAALRPETVRGNKVLVVQNLMWPEDLRNADFESLRREVTPSRQYVKILGGIVDDMTASFEEDAHVDTYAARVEELIESKVTGVPMTPREEAAAAEEVGDLLAKLEKTAEMVAGKASSKRKHPAKGRKPAAETAVTVAVPRRRARSA
jgi:DNA end-binding protein Ku